MAFSSYGMKAEKVENIVTHREGRKKEKTGGFKLFYKIDFSCKKCSKQISYLTIFKCIFFV